MVPFVAPVERDDVLRQTLHQRRMLQDDVAPEHRTVSARAYEVEDLQQEAKIHFRILNLERLVAADVEELRIEAREQFVVKPLQERQRFRQRRVERGGVLLDRAPRRHGAALRHRGERVVLRKIEPPFEMTEGVLVRHQLDVVHPAVGVQLAHLGGRERRGVAPGRLMLRVPERVFGVELELVVVADLQQIDDLAERGHRRDLVPAHIQHIATCLEHCAFKTP